MPRRSTRRHVLFAVGVLLFGWGVDAAHAQSRNQFGRADRAMAAHQLINLSIQQAISQLPPSAGQAFTFTFDPTRDTFVRSDRQGPTALLSPRTIGKGQFGARLAGSYFHVGETFDPVFYRVRPNRTTPGTPPRLFTKFGLELAADVWVVDLAVTYGITRWLDVFADLPIIVTDATADQTFAQGNTTAALRELIDFTIERTGLARQSLVERGTFPEGANVGLGRAGLGARASLYSNSFLELGTVTKVSFASPSSDQLAGSDSYAIFPRVVGEFFADAPVQAYADIGYEYDFSFAELSRLAWDVGASIPFSRGSFDLGVGGSVYDAPIKWTPDFARGDPFDDDDQGLFAEGLTLTLDEPGTNEIDNDVVNLLIGGRFAVTEQFVLSTAITVALTQNGVRPDAVGTIAVEFYP